MPAALITLVPLNRTHARLGTPACELTCAPGRPASAFAECGKGVPFFWVDTVLCRGVGLAKWHPDRGLVPLILSIVRAALAVNNFPARMC